MCAERRLCLSPRAARHARSPGLRVDSAPAGPREPTARGPPSKPLHRRTGRAEDLKPLGAPHPNPADPTGQPGLALQIGRDAAGRGRSGPNSHKGHKFPPDLSLRPRRRRQGSLWALQFCATPPLHLAPAPPASPAHLPSRPLPRRRQLCLLLPVTCSTFFTSSSTFLKCQCSSGPLFILHAHSG